MTPKRLINSLSILLLAISLYGQPASSVEYACKWMEIGQTAQLADQWHPVLNLGPFQKLDTELTSEHFHKLNTYHLWDKNVSDALYSMGFKNAEKAAVMQFCEKSLGKTPDEISAIAGKPRYAGRFLRYRIAEATTDDVLFYSFGATHQIAWLEFKDGKCQRAELCNSSDSFQFQKNKVEEIICLAKGKTVSEIIAKEGIPSSAQDIHRQDVDPFSKSCVLLSYKTGDSQTAKLNIQNGICVSTEHTVTWH